MTHKPYTLDRVVRLLIGLSISAVLYFLVLRLSHVLLPFLIGWLLAYLLHPLVLFFQHKLKFKSRVVSIVATLLLFVVVLFGFLLLVIPLVSKEIDKLSELHLISNGVISLDWIMPPSLQLQIKDYLEHLNIETILADATIMDTVKKVTPHIWSLINGSLNFLMGFAIVIVVFMYTIFILLDYEVISSKLFHIVPPKSRPVTKQILEDLEYAMNRYFRGQALVAFIVGVLFAIGFSIVHLPLAVIMGILIGVFTMVPYLKVILLLPGCALAWVQSLETGQSFWPILLGVAIVFIIVQIIEDVILVPKIMGKVTGLNPAIILFALSVWGALLGVVGMIIALPLTTLLISYYKRYVIKEIENEENSSALSTEETVPEVKPVDSLKK